MKMIIRRSISLWIHSTGNFISSRGKMVKDKQSVYMGKISKNPKNKKKMKIEIFSKPMDGSL